MMVRLALLVLGTGFLSGCLVILGTWIVCRVLDGKEAKKRE